MMRKSFVVVLAFLCSCPCTGPAAGLTSLDGALALHVSIIQVIANPEMFNGHRISMTGYLDLNGIDRSIGIYLSEADGRNLIVANSIDLHVGGTQIEGLIGKYVSISGVYHAPSPRAGYNGFIDQVVMNEWRVGAVAK